MSRAGFSVRSLARSIVYVYVVVVCWLMFIGCVIGAISISSDGSFETPSEVREEIPSGGEGCRDEVSCVCGF